MTNEEAREIILNTAFIGRSMEDIDTAIEMAAKALEQEPILDKIRAEIEEMPTYYREIIRNSATSLKMVILDEVIQILDKCKAETEEI